MDASATPIRGYYYPSMYDPSSVPLSIMQENLMRERDHNHNVYSHIVKPSNRRPSQIHQAAGGDIWDDIVSGIQGVGKAALTGLDVASKFAPLFA